MTADARRASREAFAALWRRVGTRRDPAPVYEALLRAYREPHRHYHTLQHIAEVLSTFDGVRGSLSAPDVAEVALWFHDMVYDTRATDNERRSADLARRPLEEAGVGPAVVARVADLILATAHREAPSGLDAGYVVDIDLSILGASEEEFDRYERQIRREYAWAPEAEYRERRAAVLRRFLERPAIFLTPEFRHLEAPARANLTRSLKRLTAPA